MSQPPTDQPRHPAAIAGLAAMVLGVLGIYSGLKHGQAWDSPITVLLLLGMLACGAWAWRLGTRADDN